MRERKESGVSYGNWGDGVVSKEKGGNLRHGKEEEDDDGPYWEEEQLRKGGKEEENP